jgi:hypothetical protein
MKKLLTLTLALALLATVSGLATAATTIRGSRSNGSDRVAGKVTEVNNQAKTFTVMTKGKAVVFSAAKLSKLPTVGESVDITYTQTTPGGPLEAINLNSSRSNVD